MLFRIDGWENGGDPQSCQSLRVRSADVVQLRLSRTVCLIRGLPLKFERQVSFYASGHLCQEGSVGRECVRLRW